MGPIPEGNIDEANRLLQMLRDTQRQKEFLDLFLQEERAAPWTKSGRIPTNVARSQAIAHIPSDETYKATRQAPISKLVQERQLLASKEEILRAAHALNSPPWNLPNTVPHSPGVRPPARPLVPSVNPLRMLGPLFGALELMRPGELNKGEEEELNKRRSPLPLNLNQVQPTMGSPWFQLF